jgi:hypothetical protein
MVKYESLLQDATSPKRHENIGIPMLSCFSN